ncbi:MAG TPA: class I SAM-dependent methyltransferase [Bryobacteraceae bacterium]|nr:class I SAM-dependent methyltransferase [Bryobacteraceae bacterium]
MPDNTSLSSAPNSNLQWWESNPMIYDWEGTLNIKPRTAAWFDEIDRRFLESAYYAKTETGTPFGRFLSPELVNGKTVLEIGCGMGTHAEMLIRNGAHLVAVDQTWFAIESVQRRLALKQLDATVLPQDAESLAFRDGSFDVVWTWGVIHHSRSTERCVEEIARVLKPGGRVMIMVYYRPSLVYYLHCGVIRGILMGQLLRRRLAEIYEDSTDGFYARTFTKSELQKLLSNCFRDIKISVVGLKAELYPIPRCAPKVAIERRTPDWLANGILRRVGSMVVVEAVRG